MQLTKYNGMLYTMYEIMDAIKKATAKETRQEFYRVIDKKGYYTNNVALLVFDTVEEDGVYSWIKYSKNYLTQPGTDKDIPTYKVNPTILGSFDAPISMSFGDNLSTYAYFFYRSMPEDKLIKLEYLDIVYKFVTIRESYQVNDKNTCIKFTGRGSDGKGYELYLAFAISNKKT